MRIKLTTLTVLNRIITAFFVIAAIAVPMWGLYSADFAVRLMVGVGLIVLIPCVMVSCNDLKRL